MKDLIRWATEYVDVNLDLEKFNGRAYLHALVGLVHDKIREKHPHAGIAITGSDQRCKAYVTGYEHSDKDWAIAFLGALREAANAIERGE